MRDKKTLVRIELIYFGFIEEKNFDHDIKDRQDFLKEKILI